MTLLDHALLLGGPLGTFGALWGPSWPDILPPWAETKVIYPLLDCFDEFNRISIEAKVFETKPMYDVWADCLIADPRCNNTRNFYALVRTHAIMLHLNAPQLTKSHYPKYQYPPGGPKVNIGHLGVTERIP